MKNTIFLITAGFLLTSSVEFCAKSFEWIGDDYDRKEFLRACDSITIDDLAGEFSEDRSPMDDDMVEAIEFRYRNEQFRCKKISIPKLIFALKVGQEVISSAIKIAEMYKVEKQADKEKPGSDKK